MADFILIGNKSELELNMIQVLLYRSTIQILQSTKKIVQALRNVSDICLVYVCT